MADYALYGADSQAVPAGTADALLKRNAANTGWEFKTSAQLGLTHSLLQTTFTEISVDTTTTNAGFVDLLTQVITIVAGSILLITFTGSASHSANNNTIDFQLVIDTVPVRGTTMRIPTANTGQSSSIVYRRTGLAVGAHTIKIQWRTPAATARIRPVATLVEHASLLCQEVTV
jgi:hypothetical protein